MCSPSDDSVRWIRGKSESGASTPSEPTVKSEQPIEAKVLGPATRAALEELRRVRRIPVYCGVVGVAIGAVIATMQGSVASVVFWLLFPGAVLSMLGAWLVVMSSTCPVCGNLFFLKWFVKSSILVTRCIHCGTSLKPEHHK